MSYAWIRTVRRACGSHRSAVHTANKILVLIQILLPALWIGSRRFIFFF
jgi:hypothetical protein